LQGEVGLAGKLEKWEKFIPSLGLGLIKNIYSSKTLLISFNTICKNYDKKSDDKPFSTLVFTNLRRPQG
jgi:hypothetical protein